MRPNRAKIGPMKILLLPALITLSLTVLGQKTELARGTYAENGKLISVTNLSALSDCAVQNGEGRVKSIKVEGSRAFVRLEDKEKKIGFDFEIPLERLDRDERDAIFRDLVKKKYPLRIAGYSCDSKTAIAFSVDRVY
jgi:hypothetical protein